MQWDIVRTAFGDGATTLVLIGDPKQAIYAFRGADVHTYLDAAGHASTVATLARNWRSDQDLVDAYDALFDGVTLGHPGIEYRTVAAADGHRDAALRDAPDAGAAARARRRPRRRAARPARRRGGRASTRPGGRWPPTSPPTSSPCCRRAPS